MKKNPTLPRLVENIFKSTKLRQLVYKVGPASKYGRPLSLRSSKVRIRKIAKTFYQKLVKQSVDRK